MSCIALFYVPCTQIITKLFACCIIKYNMKPWNHLAALGLFLSHSNICTIFLGLAKSSRWMCTLYNKASLDILNESPTWNKDLPALSLSWIKPSQLNVLHTHLSVKNIGNSWLWRRRRLEENTSKVYWIC